jgi:hypothetical protein
MKKSLFTLASLALAIALAFAFVACEQPVEEDAAAGSAAILRLYIDRPDGLTLSFKDNDELEIRAGQEIFVAPKDGTKGVEEYPYPLMLKPSTNGVKVPVNKSVGDSNPASGLTLYDDKIWKGWSTQSLNGTKSSNKGTSVGYTGIKIDDLGAKISSAAKDRLKVITIPPFRQNDGKIVDETSVGTPNFFGYPDATQDPIVTLSPSPNKDQEVGSVIQTSNPKMKYLYSGLISLTDTTGANAGHAAAFDAKKNSYYIDIELLDKTPGSKGYDDFFKSSGSFYLELRVGKAGDDFAGTVTEGGMLPFYYMYTPGKKGFNDVQGMIKGTAIYKTDNANIKKFSLKPGINEISLSEFSFAGQHIVDSKIW